MANRPAVLLVCFNLMKLSRFYAATLYRYGTNFFALVMPDDLRKAHQANDRAVMEAYGMLGKVHSEEECVAWLFKMYEELTKAEGK